MWDEPLAARTQDAGDYAFDAIVTASDGRDVARVRCAINRAARCGVFGEIALLDRTGTPRQRLRALVLLVREALRSGADIGITDVAAETPDALSPFISRISGVTPGRAGGRGRFRASLHAARTRVLDETDASGELVQRDSPTADQQPDAIARLLDDTARGWR